MKQPPRDIAMATIAGLVLAGCATRTTHKDDVATVRSSAPVKYEATVNNYFDLTMPATATSRRLSFGAPESSRCALHGRRHTSWVVPVMVDTSVQPAAPASVPQVSKGTVNKNAKTSTKIAAKAGPSALKTSSSGTGSSSTATVSLNDVSITGIRYFFWFNSETLGAVTRQADFCP